MIIDAVLRKLGDLERSLADLYSWYAEVLEDDAEIASTFFRMAAEEKRHANLVDYQKRMLQQDATLSVDVPADLAEIEAALDRVRALRAATRPAARRTTPAGPPCCGPTGRTSGCCRRRTCRPRSSTRSDTSPASPRPRG